MWRLFLVVAVVVVLLVGPAPRVSAQAEYVGPFLLGGALNPAALAFMGVLVLAGYGVADILADETALAKIEDWWDASVATLTWADVEDTRAAVVESGALYEVLGTDLGIVYPALLLVQAWHRLGQRVAVAFTQSELMQIADLAESWAAAFDVPDGAPVPQSYSSWDKMMWSYDYRYGYKAFSFTSWLYSQTLTIWESDSVQTVNLGLSLYIESRPHSMAYSLSYYDGSQWRAFSPAFGTWYQSTSTPTGQWVLYAPSPVSAKAIRIVHNPDWGDGVMYWRRLFYVNGQSHLITPYGFTDGESCAFPRPAAGAVPADPPAMYITWPQSSVTVQSESAERAYSGKSLWIRPIASGIGETWEKSAVVNWADAMDAGMSIVEAPTSTSGDITWEDAESDIEALNRIGAIEAVQAVPVPSAAAAEAVGQIGALKTKLFSRMPFALAVPFISGAMCWTGEIDTESGPAQLELPWVGPGGGSIAVPLLPDDTMYGVVQLVRTGTGWLVCIMAMSYVWRRLWSLMEG